jgi:hypothetical protein
MELVKFDSAYGLERLKVRVKSDKGGAWRPILAGVSALVLLIVVIWLVIVPKLRGIGEQSADQAQQQASNAWPTRTIGATPAASPNASSDPASAQAASSTATSTNPPVVNAPTSNPSANPGETWRFVIGDYKHEEDADRRIENLNKIHPELNVHKFARTFDGPFYVVSGEPMSKDDANELRKKALRMGIARTSYISDFAN